MKTKNAWQKIVGIVSILFCLFLLVGCGKEKEKDKKAPPSAPGDVHVFPGNQKVTVQWDLAAGATSYNIYLASTEGVTPSNIGTLPGGVKHSASASPFTITELNNTTPYYFVVTAVNSGGESGVSAEVSATPSASIAVALAAGENHTCALIASGEVKCWGANYSGQLGNGTSGSPSLEFSKPNLVSGINTAIAITAGRYHTCALLLDTTVKCWGEGGSGQLGNGETRPINSTPLLVSNLTGVFAIGAGEEYTCALISNAIDEGIMKCWGQNKQGQLGNGNDKKTALPGIVPDIKRSKILATGYTHVCADTQPTVTRTDRKVKCWGGNEDGQLGNNKDIDTTNPSSISGFVTQSGKAEESTSKAITLGKKHSCAIVSDGSVNCWGSGRLGQLGNGTSGIRAKSKVPVLVSSINTAREIAAGGDHTCVLLIGDIVKCWGANDTGQLGNGKIIESLIPEDVPGLTARAIVAGESHTCVITLEGGVKCWGANAFGQIGIGEFSIADTPVQVQGISGATAVSAGEKHTCALIGVGGSVKCWGSNEFGQIGNGTSTPALSPADVSGITSAVEISAGGDHACALLLGGTMHCWGKNREGQLGNSGQGELANRNVPAQVLNIHSVIAMSAGEDHTCALHGVVGNEVISCWGDGGLGQLGNGSLIDSPTPVQVNSLIKNSETGVTPKGISAGGSHTCAFLSNDEMRCWGFNEHGQLGIGTAIKLQFFTAPQEVKDRTVNANLGSVKAIELGENHTCAILKDGKMRCWGNNLHDEIGAGQGIGGTVFSLPQDVGDPGPMISVSAGDNHTCAVTSGGLKCWGQGESGQIGIGSNIRMSAPTPVALPNVTAVSSGTGHTCAVSSVGAVYCWGDNLHGQLGTGKKGTYTSPVAVVGIE